MKLNLIKKSLSIFTVLTVSLCSMNIYSGFYKTSAADEYYTLSFDLDGGVCEDTDFADMTVKGGSSTFIPEGILEKDGYYFSGWTYNNYIMYEEGDSFKMPEEDTVLVPVWVDAEDDVFRKITYDTDGGEFIEPLIDSSYLAGRCLLIPKDNVQKNGFYQYGWTDGVHSFQKGQKMIVPAHDVVLSPIWCAVRNVYYEAGDYDNIVGGTCVAFEKNATQSFELADNTRFARKGYNLTGWTCDIDGKDYITGATYIMPDCDVHFTAIWRPLSYNVKFSASTSNYVTVKASYGESLTVPECEFTKNGYVFAGWTYNDKVYWPGDKFEIPALLKGQNIVFGCNWVKASEISDEKVNCFSLIDAEIAYKNGNITLDELQQQYNFILGE